MKAISTKFVGAGNVRGSRIIATDGDGNSVRHPYPHHLNSQDAHADAALALCKKMGWTGHLVAGATRDGYVFVWLDSGSHNRYLAG